MTIHVPSAVRGYMRAQANALMTDTCTIARLSDALDASGASVNAWETVSSGVACRMISAGQRFNNDPAIKAEKAVLAERYRIVLPAGTSIAVQNRITLDSDDSAWLVASVITSQTDEVSVQVIVVPETP